MKKVILLIVVFFTAKAMSFAQFELDVRKTSETFTIEGNALEAEWDSVEFEAATNYTLGDPVADNDLAVQFKTMWSADGFYVYAEIKDDEAVAIPGTKYWNYDNFEIFFNTDWDNLTTDVEPNNYTENCWQMRINRGYDQITGGGPAFDADTVNKAINHAQVDLGSGWNVEVFVPWNLLNVTVADLESEDRTMGFELSVGDADDDGTQKRQNIIAWNTSTGEDVAWKDFNVFGRINLINPVATGINFNKVSGMNIYPNPANGYFRLKGIGQSVKYSITDISGREVQSGRTSDNELVDVSKLSKGLYIVKVGEAKQSLVKSILIY